MSNINQGQINDLDETSLKDLILKIIKWIRYLLSYWIIIVFAGLLGGIIGFSYAFFDKPIYKAELSFALEDDKASGGGLGAAAGLASQFGVDLGGSGGGGAFTGDNLLELMKSRSMVEHTLLTTINIQGKQETLAELYISFNKLRDSWSTKPELNNIHFLPNSNRASFTLQQDSVLGLFYNGIIKANLSVGKNDKKLSIITIKVQSKNELFSKYFAEALVKTVSDFYVNTKTKRSVQNVNILLHQTDSIRKELNSAIRGVASSVDDNPNANPALQILKTPSQRHQVDVTANTAILTEMIKNLEISRASLRKETPLIQIIDEPILPLDKEKLGKAKGIISGGMIGGFLMIIVLSAVSFFKEIMSVKS